MQQQKLKFGHVAILFGIGGIVLLYVVTVLSQPVVLNDFSDIEKYEGETVAVEGTVLNSYISANGEGYCSVYNDKKLLNVIFEDQNDGFENTELNSIVRITGEVQKNYNGEYELIVTDGKSLKLIGKYTPPALDWNNFQLFNNTYVKSQGTVIGLEDYYGNKQKLTLLNGTETLTSILLSPIEALEIGDNIEACGVIRKASTEHRFYVYSSEAVTITGKWVSTGVSFVELTSSPEKYDDFPINIQGCVRYEPISNPAYSFYLSDNTQNPQFNIKVDLSELNEPVIELHKGDTVSLVTTTTFDKSSARYVLTPMALEIVQRYGEWRIDIDELSQNKYEYENALLNISGYLHAVNDNFYLCNRARVENSSIFLKIESNQSIYNSINEPLLFSSISPINDNTENMLNFTSNEKIRLHARLNYKAERFDYILTLEPDPNNYFFFSYFG